MRKAATSQGNGGATIQRIGSPVKADPAHMADHVMGVGLPDAEKKSARCVIKVT